jgi:hypothetical protein
MGLLHEAYYIKSSSLELAFSRLFLDGRFEKETLLSIVEKVLQVNDPFRQKYLQICGFNEGSFDGDHSRIVASMFSASLVEFIEKHHRLENKHQAVLETLLPALGWERENVRLLLCGRSFVALAESLGYARLKREFEKGGQSFTWLSQGDLDSLNDLLKRTDVIFYDKQAAMENSLEHDEVMKLYIPATSLAELWQEALSVFKDRLTHALKDNHAILLYNDLCSMRNDRMLLPLK